MCFQNEEKLKAERAMRHNILNLISIVGFWKQHFCRYVALILIQTCHYRLTLLYATYTQENTLPLFAWSSLHGGGYQRCTSWVRWTLIVFLRNFLKTHIGNENPELPKEKINRVNPWSVSRLQHSYWLAIFTLQSKTEKNGKLLNFSNLFRIFAFLQGSWATKYVKLLVMLSINYVGLP